jgi:uncharacterized protein (DUF2126 family)
VVQKYFSQEIIMKISPREILNATRHTQSRVVGTAAVSKSNRTKKTVIVKVFDTSRTSISGYVLCVCLLGMNTTWSTARVELLSGTFIFYAGSCFYRRVIGISFIRRKIAVE